ncbi:MAG TPA: hypothetical protein VMT99_03905 [Candidatus Paceibacterota bacterium]|nr:hypothetical protein [Candidatus Paceibacterota bacterium]
MVSRFGSGMKALIVILFIAAIAATQYDYDLVKPSGPPSLASYTSPEFVRLVDMGFHSTVASALWAGTMPEILDLFVGKTEYVSDVAYVSSVDPKLGYPYAFSVIAIPAIPAGRFAGQDASDTIALAIGRKGLENVQNDWRIPYYMAIDYYLDAKDERSALTYFDVAARTPGIPDYAERFALNFGVGANQRATTEELWLTIASSTNDEATRERAQAYVTRLQIFDYLEAAARIYKQARGTYPTSTDELVAARVIPEVPPDPFGYTFVFRSGGHADIDVTKPSTLAQPLLQSIVAPK